MAAEQQGGCRRTGMGMRVVICLCSRKIRSGLHAGRLAWGLKWPYALPAADKLTGCLHNSKVQVPATCIQMNADAMSAGQSSGQQMSSHNSKVQVWAACLQIDAGALSAGQPSGQQMSLYNSKVQVWSACVQMNAGALSAGQHFKQQVCSRAREDILRRREQMSSAGAALSASSAGGHEPERIG